MSLGALLGLYEGAPGQRPYDEVVSELEHALQCADRAIGDGAPDALVVAALLHDVGHLLPTGSAHHGVDDDRHEAIGARHLRSWFGPEVTAPVALHVEAKRYLCATDESYLGRLSPASVHSLGLQGGPMSDDEVGRFSLLPHRSDAVRLRRWDDAAKVSGASTRSLSDHLPLLDRVAALPSA